METADFKKLLDEQARTIETNVDRKIDAAVTELKEYTDNAVKKSAKSLTKRIDDQAEESRRYTGALNEDYQSKIEAVIEYTKPIGKMQEDIKEIKETVQRNGEILAATFERVGELSVDMTTTQETVKNHEERITVLEKA